MGSHDLYSASAVQAIQTREMGCTTPSAIFIRLPYFAGLMRPWTWIPFWPAFALWRLANVLAVAVFIWLWPVPREWSLLACAWSLPLHATITNGQDVGFLLMWLAVAAVLLNRNAAFPAGLSLAMCAAKFHLFVLLPMLFEARLRKLGYGFVAGAMALLALCFAIGGLGWPREFVAAATDSRIDPTPSLLCNARGIAHGSVALEIAIDALVLGAAVYVFRRGDLWNRFAFVLTGGLLLSRHYTMADAALLIPVALILAFHAHTPVTKALAIFLVSPLAYALGFTPGLAEIPRLALLVLAGLIAWEVRPPRIDLLQPVSG